jgi:hypothetical protein
MTLSFPPFTLVSAAFGACAGGSYGPDHPLARVDVQPGSVGRDCPCDGHVPRMRTSLGVKVDRADRPGRSCSGCRGVERYGHGMVVIGTATCLVLPRNSGASPDAPGRSHDTPAQTASRRSDRSVRAISGGGRERIQEGLSRTQPWAAANRDATLGRRRGADPPVPS